MFFFSRSYLQVCIQRWTTKQNQCAGQSHWYPNKDSQYCFWLTSQVCLWITIDSPCLALFPPFSSAIDSLANEFASCHFARQLSLSNLAHLSASGERKRGARSIDVNYADVTRDGAHWSVSPPKESIKVRQLVFSPRFFFFPLFQGFNNVTTVMDTASASPDKLSRLNLVHLTPTTHLHRK